MYQIPGTVRLYETIRRTGRANIMLDRLSSEELGLLIANRTCNPLKAIYHGLAVIITGKGFNPGEEHHIPIGLECRIAKDILKDRLKKSSDGGKWH